MIGREWISDLVEPRKGNCISRIYDCIMLVAIAIGTAHCYTCLMAQGDLERLKPAVKMALDNGVSSTYL